MYKTTSLIQVITFIPDALNFADAYFLLTRRKCQLYTHLGREQYPTRRRFAQFYIVLQLRKKRTRFALADVTLQGISKNSTTQ